MPARLQYAPSQTATRSRRRSAGSSLLAPGRCPASTSAWRTHLRSDSAVAMPSFAATDQIASYPVTYSPRCSITKRTARSRSSLGYGFGMKIILPRKEVSTEPGAVHWEQALVRYTKLGIPEADPDAPPTHSQDRRSEERRVRQEGRLRG